jgi:hypothetical protein
MKKWSDLRRTVKKKLNTNENQEVTHTFCIFLDVMWNISVSDDIFDAILIETLLLTAKRFLHAIELLLYVYVNVRILNTLNIM